MRQQILLKVCYMRDVGANRCYMRDVGANRCCTSAANRGSVEQWLLLLVTSFAASGLFCFMLVLEFFG